MAYLLTAFYQVFSPMSMLFIVIGVVTGVVIGAIPGLSGSMLMALTIPLTYYMGNVHSMDLMIGQYIGAISGGLITAILLRIPGTPSSVVTTFDGYPMARAGFAGRAIGVGVVASFVGGLISWIVLVLLSPPLSDLALKFGPFELFSLVLTALVLIAAIGRGSLLKGILSGLFGMLVSTPGLDPVTGQARLTFGFGALIGGFSLVPVLIGVFGISQIIRDVTELELTVERIPLSFRGMFLSLRDLRRHAVNLIRSSLIGTWVGILPGIGGSIGSILSYSAAKNTSKTPEKFGTGIEDGIVASEAGNNATIGGALIPLLTLGIPGSINDAILIGALILHGVRPGPLLFSAHPDIAYGMIVVALVANVFMLLFMFVASVVVARAVDIPKAVLVPIIVTFMVVGTFALDNRFFDVWSMFVFGIVGFLFEKAKVPLAPFVIGLILSPLAETNMRSALMLSGGSLLPLFTHPISLIFVVISVATLAWTLYGAFSKRKSGTVDDLI